MRKISVSRKTVQLIKTFSCFRWTVSLFSYLLTMEEENSGIIVKNVTLTSACEANMIFPDHRENGCCNYYGCKCPYNVFKKCCFSAKKCHRPKVFLWSSMTKSNFEMFLEIIPTISSSTAAFRNVSANNSFGRKLVSHITDRIIGGLTYSGEVAQVHVIFLGRNDALVNPGFGDKTALARVKTLANRFFTTHHRILFCSAVAHPTDLHDVTQCLARLNEQMKFVIERDYQQCARFIDLSGELVARGCLEKFDAEKLFFSSGGLTKLGVVNVFLKIMACAKEAATEAWLDSHV